MACAAEFTHDAILARQKRTVSVRGLRALNLKLKSVNKKVVVCEIHWVKIETGCSLCFVLHTTPSQAALYCGSSVLHRRADPSIDVNAACICIILITQVIMYNDRRTHCRVCQGCDRQPCSAATAMIRAGTGSGCAAAPSPERVFADPVFWL